MTNDTVTTEAAVAARTILLADGRPAALGSLAGGLARDGLRVLVGSDAGTAFEVLVRERPAMVLLHHALVGADGATLRQLHSLSPGLPIVVYGVAADPDPRRREHPGSQLGTATVDGEDPGRLRELVSSTLLATSCVGRLRDEYELRALLLTQLCQALRAPLHVIQGYADLLRDAPATPAIQAALAGLSRAVADALQVTAHHVAAAGFDAPGFEARCGPIELDGLLDELRRDMAQWTRGQGVRLLASAPFPGAVLYGDADRLRVLLGHLIACSARRPTRVTLRLRVRCTMGGTRFELTTGRAGTAGAPAEPGDDAGWAIAERLSVVLGASLALRRQSAGRVAIALDLPTPLIPTPAPTGRPVVH
jgi:signal transduction histidine kinase